VEPEEFTIGVAELDHVLYTAERHKDKDVTSAEITILSSHMASLQELDKAENETKLSALVGG
jgi:uncharacterized protein YraI